MFLILNMNSIKVELSSWSSDSRLAPSCKLSLQVEVTLPPPVHVCRRLFQIFVFELFHIPNHKHLLPQDICLNKFVSYRSRLSLFAWSSELYFEVKNYFPLLHPFPRLVLGQLCQIIFHMLSPEHINYLISQLIEIQLKVVFTSCFKLSDWPDRVSFVFKLKLRNKPPLPPPPPCIFLIIVLNQIWQV